MKIFETGLGPVEGHVEGGCIRVSRLRYAKSPVGSRRFARPEPLEPWSEPVGGPGPAVAPPQLPSRLARVMGDYPFEQSEDCLHLDIWIPRGAEAPLPVFVFIHGGAFQTGGGSLECYNGGTLAARERIIVVTITSRLGLLGFMPIEGLAPANLALQDQLAALRFIRANIEAFGGDADNITLGGQSAGANSAAIFMMHPEGRSLFKRGILMSGMLTGTVRDPDAASAIGQRFLAKMGVGRDDVERLRVMDLAQLMEAQQSIIVDQVQSAGLDSIALPFLPVADGDLVSNDLMATFETGVAAWCPMMVGATREEFAAFWFDNEQMEEAGGQLLRQRFAEAFPDAPEATLERARRRRTPRTNIAALVDFHSHMMMIEPARREAAAHARMGATAFAYQVDWQSPVPELGACHCIDLPMLFGNLDTWQNAAMIAGASRSELEGLRETVQGAVGSFVRTGDPNPGVGIDWPAFGTDGNVLHYDRVSHCETRHAYP